MAVAVTAVLGGCGSDSAAPRATTTSTTATSTTATSTTVTGSVARSAAELAARLGCPSTTAAQAGDGEPVKPASARSCTIGEASFTVAVYDTAAQREQLMNWLNQFAGYRAVGLNWIVAVDTPESARLAADRLGGAFVELAGTAHG